MKTCDIWKKIGEENFNIWKKKKQKWGGNEKKCLLTKLWTQIISNCYLLLKTNMTNDSLNTIQKLFKLHAVDAIHPSKRTILKFYSVLYHEIVIHCQSQICFVAPIGIFRITKTLHACVTLVTNHTLGRVFGRCMADIQAKIYLRYLLRFLRKNVKRKSKIFRRPHFDFSKLWLASSKFESSDRD